MIANELEHLMQGGLLPASEELAPIHLPEIVAEKRDVG
jgi:hypothetical protein